MKFVAGKMNGVYLENFLYDSAGKTEWVKAAIAYATDTKLLNFCFEKKIRITYFGRYDSSVPVSTTILKWFLDKQSPNYICRLVAEAFHPKVIWWQGYGAYIGSANLTQNGWYQNVEAGVFLSEDELMSNSFKIELEQFFDQLEEEYSQPLTEEIFDEQVQLLSKLNEASKARKSVEAEFEKNRIIPRLSSIVDFNKKKSVEKRKASFLKEWDETLQILRDISHRISKDEFRPNWIDVTVPRGVQTDQFLHAYYYNKVKSSQESLHNELFEEHKNNPERYLSEEMNWWKETNSPPGSEGVMINEWAPFLNKTMYPNNFKAITKNLFVDLCIKVHAIRDHSYRVDKKTLGLPENGVVGGEERIKIFATWLWDQRSEKGKTPIELIYWILYGGNTKDVPSRLWEGVNSSEWAIPHLGISSLGEIVGWALPDDFIPRNGRTSKALKALGFPVRIHTE